MWTIEDIPNTDSVFRQIHFSHFSDKKKRCPNEAHFIPDNDGLSVNWNRYCDIENVYYLLGISKNASGKYKKPFDFKVFKLKVEFLLGINGIQEIKHNPVENNPEIEGNPNNRSHSLIIYPNDEEIRLSLCDFILANYEDVCCRDYNRESILKRIEEKIPRIE